jgi:hypothetical protein
MFQVVWLQSALNDLAALWVRADSVLRQAINAATNAIDQSLQDDPENLGESRSGETCVFFAHPLGVSFQVDSSQRVVSVLHVWDIRKRRP